MNKSWDGEEIEITPCPFCGTIPEIIHIGNNYTRKKAVKVRCRKCRVARTTATLTQSFAWLEKAAVRNWDQRPATSNNEEE